MKAKLIKTVDGYELLTQGFLRGSTNHGLIDSLNIEEGSIRYKLSLKNCQSIERGYDLDELAEEWIDVNSHKWSNNNNEVGDNYGSFKSGFQKSIELVGDKKFSEEDVLKVVTHVLNELVLVDGFDKQYLFPESIYQETTTKCKSLQRVEWDVEIVMEKVKDKTKIIGSVKGVKGSGHKITTYKSAPKLDVDGCLILKRI
jgi:hypothetical protein